MKRRTARLLRHFANKLDSQDFREVVQPGTFRKNEESLKLDLDRGDVTPVHFGGVSKVFYNGDPVDLEKVIVTTMRKHLRQNGERLA